MNACKMIREQDCLREGSSRDSVDPSDGEQRSRQRAGEIPVRLHLPFKDQRSANKLREQLGDFGRKMNTGVHPVFTSQKIKDERKA